MMMVSTILIMDETADATPLLNGWTLLVFVGADNSLAEQVEEDLEEMVNANSEIDIIVLSDQEFDGDTRLHHIENGVMTQLSTPPSIGNEANMGTISPYTLMIDYVADYYPAEHYGMVFYNHGMGWGGINFDVTSGDYLTNNELRLIFQHGYDEFGDYIDLIGFDACYMNMVDILYEAKDYANVFVGSEDTETWDGWNWNFLSVCDDNTSEEQMATKICHFYKEDAQYDAPQYTLSAINLTLFDTQVMESYNILFQTLSTVAQTHSSSIINSVYNTETYLDKQLFHFYDLYDFASQIQSNIANSTIQAKAQDLKDSITSAVIENNVSSGHGNGIAFYMGIGAGEFFFPYLENYMCQYTFFDEFQVSLFSNRDNDLTVPDIPTLSVSNNKATITGTGIQWKVNRGRWNILPATISLSGEDVYFRSFNGDAYSPLNVTSVTADEIDFTVSLVERHINFREGWNIFTPFAITDELITASSLINELGLNDTKIVYRSTDGVYEIYIQGRSRDDFILERGKAYYIYVVEDVQYYITGIVEESQSITLEQGWNFIGYFANKDITASEMVDNNPYIKFVVKRGYGPYLTYFPQHREGNDFTIQMGDGIYLYAESRGGLEV